MQSRSHCSGDGSQQDIRVYRLGHVFAGALAHAPAAVGFAFLAGHENNVEVAGLLVLVEFPGGCIAAHTGHHDVHQDGFGLIICSDLKSFFPGFDRNCYVAALLDQFPELVEL